MVQNFVQKNLQHFKLFCTFVLACIKVTLKMWGVCSAGKAQNISPVVQYCGKLPIGLFYYMQEGFICEKVQAKNLFFRTTHPWCDFQERHNKTDV